MRISDSGVVNIASGVSQVVKEMYVDGEQVLPGIYGGADAPEGVNKTYADHFSGEGTIRVSGGGLVLMIF